MNILHISGDEKFIDKAIETFNEVDFVTNTFFILSNELKYIKNKESVRLLDFLDILNLFAFKEFKKYNAIIFHGLTSKQKLILKFLPKSSEQKIVWIGFGFDYYDYIDASVFLDEYLEVPSFKNIVSSYFKSFVFKVLRLDSSFNKVDYFSPVLASEYVAFKNAVKINAKYLDWDYGSTFSILEKFKNKKITGDNILLGNSATRTNNHISAFDLINNLVSDKKIVLPLSYGDKNYKKWLEYEMKRFDLNFEVLDKFLTLEEYFEVLLGCKYVIMNHVRQQALGNIIVMLSLGAKVFLRPKNPLYSYLIEKGFYVYSVEDIDLDSFKEISSYKANENMRLTHELYNENMLKNKTLNLIGEIKSNAQ